MNIPSVQQKQSHIFTYFNFHKNPSRGQTRLQDADDNPGQTRQSGNREEGRAFINSSQVLDIILQKCSNYTHCFHHTHKKTRNIKTQNSKAREFEEIWRLWLQ